MPFNLMNQELEEFKQSNPRNFPIFAHSSYHRDLVNDQRRRQAVEGKAKPRTSVREAQGQLDDAHYTSREQIGAPLEPHPINLSNYDVYRASILTSETTKISESRTLIWEELERDAASQAGSGGGAARFGWDHQWQFFKAVDDWVADMTHRADWGCLLKSSLDIKDGASVTMGPDKGARESNRDQVNLGDGVKPSIQENPHGLLKLSVTRMSNHAKVALTQMHRQRLHGRGSCTSCDHLQTQPV